MSAPVRIPVDSVKITQLYFDSPLHHPPTLAQKADFELKNYLENYPPHCQPVKKSEGTIIFTPQKGEMAEKPNIDSKMFFLLIHFLAAARIVSKTSSFFCSRRLYFLSQILFLDRFVKMSFG